MISASVLRGVIGNYIEDTFKFNIVNHGAVQDLEIQYRNTQGVWTTLKTIRNVVSETEYTFTSVELDTLYGAFTTTDVVKLQFILKSYSSNSRQYPLSPISSITKNLFIKPYEFNWDPPYFTFEDTNAVTTALTGNNSILIKGYSTIEYTIPENYKPTAIKGASIDFYDFKKSNGEYITVNETSGQINGPSCTNYNQDYFEVIAADSRGISVVRSKSPTKLINDYYTPSANLEFERIDGIGEGGQINLYISYWYGNFAGSSDTTKENTIKSVYYRVKPVNGSFSNWVDITSSMTISNGIASANDLRIYYNGNNFDIGTSYVVEIKAVDGTSAQDFNEISGVTATLSDGTVLDSYYKDSNGNYKYAINKLVDKNGATLQVDGDTDIDGDLDVDGDLYLQNNKTMSYISNTGGLIIGANNGNLILRPNGVDDNTGQMVLDDNGNLSVDNSGTFNGALKVEQNGISNELENSYGFAHYTTNGSNGHWFNTDVKVQGNVYAGESYNRQLAFKDETPYVHYEGTGKDLNNYKTAGMYGMYNCTNQPTAIYSSIGVLMVIPYTTDWVVQLWFEPQAKPVIWQRSWYGGNTWSSWYKITPSNTITFTTMQWRAAYNPYGAGWRMYIPFHSPQRTDPTLSLTSCEYFGTAGWKNCTASVSWQDEEQCCITFSGITDSETRDWQVLIRMVGTLSL